jgi:membrane protein
MANHLKDIWTVLGRAGNNLIDDRVFRMSAALAYYTVFSVAPMLIVITTLCDLFYGPQVIEGRIYTQIRGFLGDQAALEIQEIIQKAIWYLHHNTIAKITGFAALLFGATSVFSEIQDALNIIWRVRAKPVRGWLRVILTRLLSFSMVLVLGFILLVSLVINALIDLLSAQFSKIFPHLTVYVVQGLNHLLTFGITFLLFGTIFKVLPDVKMKWKDVSIGAFTTTFLFLMGRFGIGYYLHLMHIDSSYGAAGSIVAMLLWVYYSALILYFGAEFTREYAHLKGRFIRPNDYAVWVKQVEEKAPGTDEPRVP